MIFPEAPAHVARCFSQREFGRGIALQAEGTRFVRGGRRAALAAFASVLLASCATSDGDVPFGLASVAPQPAGATNDFAQPTTNSAASTFVVEEGDPALPDAVASAPANRPLLDGETAPAEQAVAAVPAQASPQDEAGAQAAAVAVQTQPEAGLEQQAAMAQQQPEEQGSTDQEPVAADAQQTQPVETAAAQQAPAQQQPRKRNFLSSFFGTSQARAAPSPVIQRPAAQQQQNQEAGAAAKPLIQLASTGETTKPLVASALAADGPALPGVRQDSLFEISRKSGMDDDSDIDLHEGEEAYEVASAAGLARLAPNGLMKQTENVDVACLKPSLVRVLKTIESHYGSKLVVTSGYRNQDRNRKARGARNSLHMYCAAADVQVAGVSKWELAEFVRAMPGRGGVGTYCHTNSVHVDVGPERDWNWRCRRRK